ncbi:FkbM family methyltransferase [Moheibacter sediminis]|uniref:Methyltransferase, FkbM family n=1 Tax=Moheibacter sediminis TaxID=1434700 RepID=A0A1W1YGK9_9FLAO|nr:FkbM family methyltransferase [Moheibacter sediminis]SMC35276.1 methyltransferase, FkbM family [Moheibacter sediminis]
MIKNYISKIFLAIEISRNFKTFLNLIINSKKYSGQFKKNIIDAGDLSSENYQMKISQKKIDILMRTYKGDINIFYEIFWKKVYAIPPDFVQNPLTIIDLGGHVGFTSIYYSLQYPNAKIFSVEASRENFNILQSNVRQFENIIPINKAIYPIDGEVLFDESGFSYNTKISNVGKPIESVSVNTLMKTYGFDNIDLMKIDIEGAESELLKTNTEWLEKTDTIIIELHNPYGLGDLEKDLEPFGFKIINPTEENNLQNILAVKNKI